MDQDELVDIIRKLQQIRQEWNTVDAKQDISLKEVGAKAEFVKDVVAMANNGKPSFLIIGLEDGTFNPVGTLNHRHKKNDINQILADKIDPPITVGYQEFVIDGNEYAVIEIYGQNPPYIVARDLVHSPQDRKRVRIDKGTIYVRHEDRTEGISRFELEKYFKGRLRKIFENETEYALHLALNKPDHWEYLLTAELLQSKFDLIRRGFDELEKGLLYKRAAKMNGIEFLKFSGERCSGIISLIGVLKTVVSKEMPESWKEEGGHIDPLNIKQVVDQLYSACNELLKWEIDFRSVIIPDSFHYLRKMIEGWALQCFSQIERLPEKLLKIPEFAENYPDGVYNITIILDEPINLKQALTELNRLNSLQ